MSIVLDGTSGLTTNSGTLISASTIGVGGATPSASGSGISFPATQSASTDGNTLDDYEEGNWTPSIGGTATYLYQVGRYTKIGRMVYVSALVHITLVGTGSTTVISGLPFALSNVQDVESSFSVAASSTIATNVVSFSVYVTSSTIVIQSRTAAAAAPSSNAIFQNSASIEIAGWYQTAT